MKVCVLKPLLHDQLGPLRKGRIVDVPEPWASKWLAVGAVERYETKVIREVPLADAGREVPLSASPVVQASTEPMSKESKPGAKKKAKKRGASS